MVEVAQAAERELAEESSAEAIVRRKAGELLVALWTANRNASGGEPSPFTKLCSDLEAIGPRAAPYLVDVLTAAEQHPAADHLAGHIDAVRAPGGPTPPPPIRRLLREGRLDLRRRLLEVLAWGKVNGGAMFIVATAADREAIVRAAAVRALRTYADRTVHDTATALIGDPDPSVRMAALDALGERLAGPGDLAALRAAYADPEAGVRAAAVAAVARTLARAERGTTAHDLSREVALLADSSPEVLAALVEFFGSAPGGLPAEAIEPVARRIASSASSTGPPATSWRGGSEGSRGGPAKPPSTSPAGCSSRSETPGRFRSTSR